MYSNNNTNTNNNNNNNNNNNYNNNNSFLIDSAIHVDMRLHTLYRVI